jgi:hypothetical protein
MHSPFGALLCKKRLETLKMLQLATISSGPELNRLKYRPSANRVPALDHLNFG